MSWEPPTLRPARVIIDPVARVDDPTAFLRGRVGDDGIVVVETMTEVSVLPITDLAIGEATLMVHAFSEGQRSQARVAREGEAWVGDAVREVVGNDHAPAVEVWARAGRHLCLGKAMPGDGGPLMAEARVRPYRLPISIAEGQVAEIEFVDYHAVDEGNATLDCIGHRVVAIRARTGG